MKKRILAILLSLCMVLSLTPAVAFAGENTSMLNGTPLTQSILLSVPKQQPKEIYASHFRLMQGPRLQYENLKHRVAP